MVNLKFIGFLADLADKKEIDLSCDKLMKLRDLLPFTLPEDRIIVLVNQKGATLDCLINDNDQILILPIISGG